MAENIIEVIKLSRRYSDTTMNSAKMRCGDDDFGYQVMGMISRFGRRKLR